MSIKYLCDFNNKSHMCIYRIGRSKITLLMYIFAEWVNDIFRISFCYCKINIYVQHTVLGCSDRKKEEDILRRTVDFIM